MKNRIAAAAALVAALAVLPACSMRQADAALAPEPVPPPPPTSVEVLSGDSLFAFGKASVEDFSPEGRQQLDALAERLRLRPLAGVHVIGHSDRIGSDEANRTLSLRRAEAVRDYLAQAGLDEELMTLAGWGSESPVVACEDARGEALVSCLAPNRRVEVRVRYAD